MKCNVGKLDRFIRASIGLGLGAYALVEFNIVAAIVSLILLFTAVTRWCIPYQLIGINTGCDLKKHRSITGSLIEGMAVSLVVYLIVLLVYLIWKYVILVMS